LSEQNIPEAAEGAPVQEKMEGLSQPQEKALLYLMPRESLSVGKPLPSFDQVKDQLVAYDSLDDLPKFVYVSHSWFTDDHADDENGSKASILVRALKTMRKVKYVWIDYSCLDQAKDEEIEKSLGIIQKITDLATRILILPLRVPGQWLPGGNSGVPVYDMSSFKSQAWCIFEACYFLKRPSRCRVVRCRPSDQAEIGFAVELNSFPSKDEADEVAQLLEGFHEAQRCVAEGRPDQFGKAFRPRSRVPADAVYQAMAAQKELFFGSIRDPSDYMDPTLPSWKSLKKQWTPTPKKHENHKPGLGKAELDSLCVKGKVISHDEAECSNVCLGCSIS